MTSAALDLIGFVLAIPTAILAIFLTGKLSLAPYIAATNELGPITALARSWQLTRHNFWRTTGVLFAVWIIDSIISTLLGGVSDGSVVLQFFVAVPLIQMLTIPYLSVAFTIILYDLKLRRQGFDAVKSGS